MVDRFFPQFYAWQFEICTSEQWYPYGRIRRFGGVSAKKVIENLMINSGSIIETNIFL